MTHDDDQDLDDEKSGERAPEPRKAKEELFEAIEHFKNAANILFERASREPAVRKTTQEAERLVTKLGQTAEPLARQLTTELSKLTRTIIDTVDSKRKSETPPPPEKK